MKKLLLLFFLAIVGLPLTAQRERLCFNASWLMHIGDDPALSEPTMDDDSWEHVTLPHAFNEHEAYRVSIEQLSDTVIWYRKHFNLSGIAGHKYFLEVEGVRFGADVWLNGHRVGWSDNGVMAFGLDLTPYVKEGENIIAIRCDNSWNYHERSTGSPFQWNDKNFNANYGGMVKNVWLHVTGLVYQTLPLYSSLHTTGTYIYGSDYDIAGHAVTVNVESEIQNADNSPHAFMLRCIVKDLTGKEVLRFNGSHLTLASGATGTVRGHERLTGAHFWSWGYGYLYTVTTQLVDDRGSVIDAVDTKTGFRSTHFGDGKVWLNDRVMMVHGYAQRTSNEWPALGIDVPAWLSDYSNHLMVASGGNLVRWMHVCPSKQDVESCDRVGLPQAMPAGDAEKDVSGRRWEQRVEVMRDAMIYNRNNPSILFYECGNRGISREHMVEMKALRDKLDPYGGRAIGSREMLDVDEAEYGGEMLYVNKSARKPMWAMEYCRDEGLRKYWDNYSYPYHQEGSGPLYRGKPAGEYNHNMDQMAVTLVDRWNDFYRERPGTGRRVSAGGVKIVFSDTNTHHRGELNYRTSGVVDAMRLPKDGFFAHRVMWDGWVMPEYSHTHIVGHWNYPDGTVKPVYVVSSADSVRLLVNGNDQGAAQRSSTFLFSFPHVTYKKGKLVAISYQQQPDGRWVSVSSDTIISAGKPHHLQLTTIQNPLGFKADGSDVALVQVEVVDSTGTRCPLDNRVVNFHPWGEGEWIGGIASNDSTPDNYIGARSLPIEAGVGRVIIRSTTTPGTIYLTASAQGLRPVTISMNTDTAGMHRSLPCRLERGETPGTPSYKDSKEQVAVVSVTAGCNRSEADLSIDDNERTEWKSDGLKDHAWIEYHLARKQVVDEIALKLTGWRSLCYPLAIYEDGKKVWQGITNPSLGYVHIKIEKPRAAHTVRIKMLAPATTHQETGDTKELAGGKASEMDRVNNKEGKTVLRIVEADLLRNIK